MISEQISNGFDGDRPLLCDLGENAVKRAGLERVVQRDRDRMDRRSLVSQPDGATLLTNHSVAEALQGVDHAICGNATWQSHAASTAINSSFT